jgi:ATP-binding cassette subfamily B protein
MDFCPWSFFSTTQDEQGYVMSGWRIVSSYIRKHWLVYSVAITIIASSSLLAVQIPKQLGHFADKLQHGTLTVAGTTVFAGILVLLGIGRVTAAWTGRTLSHRRGRTLTYELRRDLLKKWTTLSPTYYHGHSVGELLSHALSDVEVVRELVTMGINQATAGLMMLATVLYMMLTHGDWRLTLAGLGPLFVIPVLVRYLGPKIRLQSQRCQESLGSMAQSVEEVIGGIRTVKAFGNERVVIDRFEEKLDSIVREKNRFIRHSSLFGSLVPLMANLGFINILGYGGYLAINKAISLGDYVSFTLYIALLRNPLEHLGQVLNIIQRASASLNRIAELLQVEPQVRDRQEELLDRPLLGDVRVTGLTFRYPGTERDVLTDISFRVGRGKTLGIIGPMGSGKTTLADLLLRLYDPPEGSVFIDNEDIFRYPLARLRQGVGYVPQDGFLFSATLTENIGFADDHPDAERVRAAAKIAAVYENIERFPEGFETEVGERGVRLSGGQKQRVAIARVVYKDAPIRIFDDSLSAIDTSTERVILRSINSGNSFKNHPDDAAGKTSIIISHRLSSVQHADEIIVLDEGRIVERGNHAELIATAGVYAGIWQMQAGSTGAVSPLRPVQPDDEAYLSPGLTAELAAMQDNLEEVVA